MTRKNDFRAGIIDGLPIGIGYLSVSFGFGVMAQGMGFSPLTAVIVAMTNIASAGQVAGITIIAACGTLIEMMLAQFVVNVRYSLMALSLTQKADASFSTPKRILLSMFITDEIFAVASSKGSVNSKYFSGLALLPYIGWSLGTLLGAVAGEIMPQSVSSAMGIAIYGMFIAIVIPPSRKSFGVLLTVVISAILACIIKYVPVFSFISEGFAIIICAVIAATIGAIVRPVPVDEEETEEVCRRKRRRALA